MDPKLIKHNICLELKIHISPHTKEILDKFGTFEIKKRSQSVEMKVSEDAISTLHLVTSKIGSFLFE